MAPTTPPTIAPVLFEECFAVVVSAEETVFSVGVVRLVDEIETTSVWTTLIADSVGEDGIELELEAVVLKEIVAIVGSTTMVEEADILVVTFEAFRNRYQQEVDRSNALEGQPDQTTVT